MEACTTSNGSGVGQKQMETSSSSLIIIEVMEASRERETLAGWERASFATDLIRILDR